MKTNTILLVALIALLTWNVRGLVTSSPKSEKMIRAEERIKALEEKRLSDSLLNEAYLKQKDAIIAILRDRDTVLVTKYMKSNEKLKTIPVTVRNYTNEELRRAIYSFRE